MGPRDFRVRCRLHRGCPRQCFSELIAYRIDVNKLSIPTTEEEMSNDKPFLTMLEEERLIEEQQRNEEAQSYNKNCYKTTTNLTSPSPSDVITKYNGNIKASDHIKNITTDGDNNAVQKANINLGTDKTTTINKTNPHPSKNDKHAT